MWGRVLVCCILAACAGDNRLDPSDLELRDVLGVSPETAMAWDAGQRAAARRVIDAALHDAPSQTALASDRSVEKALAVADGDREKHHLPAMGVVALDAGRATSRISTLAPRAALPIELKFAGWADRPGWAELPARGIDVLSTLATDAGHRNGPVVVTPAPHLAVIAGYVPGNPARLVVNPVLLASLEPRPPGAPSVVASEPIANPYTFYSSVGECATAQRTRCEACLPNGTCTPLTGLGDGMAECRQLALDDGRGYSLVCINFALAIDSVAACAAASGCPIDSHAAESISSLDHNADFLDRAECANPLDRCLEVHAGTAPPSTSPSSPSESCDASGCDASGCDGACDDSGGSSGADDGCSSDSSDGCDGGDSGGDCGGGGGDDCSSSSGGGDCGGGGGGDCAGDSGGDCSGGGGDDCNVGGTRSHGYLWACLPLPFAVIARRRADRRRARKEVQS